MTLGACLSNRNTLLVGRLRRQKRQWFALHARDSAPTRSPFQHYSDGLLAGDGLTNTIWRRNRFEPAIEELVLHADRSQFHFQGEM
jgi:hypothetical protein